MDLFGPPDVGKLKAKHDVKGLIKALCYRKDANVRQAAAGALGEIGDALAVAPLIAALKDSTYVRLAALDALGQIGAPAVEPVIAALTDEDRDLRHYASVALKRIGVPAVERLIAAFPYGDASMREAVAAALGEIGDPLAIPTLLDALDDRSRQVRWNAANALGKIGDPRAVEPLIAALEDEASVVRQFAAYALAKIRDPRAVKPLVASLKDGDLSVRRAATEALDQLDWKPSRSQAGAAYWIEKRQWDECVRIGAPAVKPLIATLSDTRVSMRRAAAKALVSMRKSGKLSNAHHSTLKAAVWRLGGHHADSSSDRDYFGDPDYRYHKDSFSL